MMTNEPELLKLDEEAQRFRQRLVLIAKGRHGARDMSREQAEVALSYLFSGRADPAQIGAFLTAMRFKGTKHDEYLGFFDAIDRVNAAIRPSVPKLLNSNGPYDGRQKSLQLQAGTGLLVAAAGLPVLLHSSSGLTPKRGVTPGHVLAWLGVPVHLEPGEVKREIEERSFAYLHSERFNFGIERLRPQRLALHYRSFLHACEVMLNPAGAEYSVIGAAHEGFLEKFARVQMERGCKRILVVQGLDGSDEAPMTAAAAVEVRAGELKQISLDPASLNLPRSEPLPSLNAESAARLTLEALTPGSNGNEQSSIARRAMLYNAALRLYTGDIAESPAEGLELAPATIESGAARSFIEKLARPSLFEERR